MYYRHLSQPAAAALTPFYSCMLFYGQLTSASPGAPSLLFSWFPFLPLQTVLKLYPSMHGGHSRFAVVSARNAEFIFVLFVNYCYFLCEQLDIYFCPVLYWQYMGIGWVPKRRSFCSREIFGCMIVTHRIETVLSVQQSAGWLKCQFDVIMLPVGPFLSLPCSMGRQYFLKLHKLPS